MTETKKKRPATKAAKPKQGDKPAMQKNTQSDIVVTEATIADLIPDDKNLNKGTQFGQHLIEKSLRELGAGRSLLLDKNNRIITGNKTTENAAAIDLNDVIIVESDGTKLVAVKRTDIDLDSERGRKLALADNATSAANLEWDEEQMAAMAEEIKGFDPSEWGVELAKAMEEEANAMIGQASSSEATSSYSDNTEYDLGNMVRSRLNPDISQRIKDGIADGSIRAEIAEIIKARESQCTVFNFDEITRFYRSNDSTETERQLLRRLYLVFVAPKELFDEHVLRLNTVAQRIYDDELMSAGGEDDGE